MNPIRINELDNIMSKFKKFEISCIENKISSMYELQNDIFETILKRKNLILEKLILLKFKDVSKDHYFYKDKDNIVFIVTFNIRVDNFLPILSVIEELPKETYDKCRMEFNIQNNKIDHE